ncbi:tRNA/rRNA methyltransferase (SpoU) [Xylanimonas cellulosilytica DSM 15894]|uniref:tRNA/rRNA methyltransferase (SpoU) n=1 Tax=Xylanimonas cellulosilytica (strain DSM 15894 / JCM 12276 / CECT 5975 / KCTC 9989 / LMG 20990 / NBRC 107835 / XIL07) TaxID=446471 RepID=D1BVA0_XYLCX|nr:TrmH family RNA methyltransferase [Xylanimonas cellulosilytica]ACZ29371.1 tRNA/rRNA methyltransferase (SpoU) [Xylanimonas cellulosilytica DSM 15894]
MAQKISKRNARFQELEALLTNRSKRSRSGHFLVQGVRPVTLAVEHGWQVDAFCYEDGRRLSDWARGLLHRTGPEHYALSADLLAELAEKPEGEAELVAVVSVPDDDLDRVPVPADFLGVVLDRPTQPGNVGSIIRSADAFGAHGVIVTGHGADPYDPRAVRATTGSLFAVPVVRAPSHREVLDQVAAWRAAGTPVTVVATDEDGDVDIAGVDLTGPVLLLVGNETAGLTRAWRESADAVASIPMVGAASSLNAANAASVVLYEARRQRAVPR